MWVLVFSSSAPDPSISPPADISDTGMPQEWQKILDDNGITRAEQEENPREVLEVVKFFQERDAMQSQEDDVWAKMRDVGPAHATTPSPRATPTPLDMSREGSREGTSRMDQYGFANPVSDARSRGFDLR